jgi:RNA polymerase sigma factor (sigma-70 family)
METQDVRECVQRAQRGEKAALEALVRRFMRPAYAVALSVVRLPAEAEDLAQESMAMAVGNIQACREPERFAGWLLTQVRNRALNQLSSRQVRERHASAERLDEGGGSTDRVMLRAQLNAALEVLSARERSLSREKQLYEQLLDTLGDCLEPLKQCAGALSELDVLAGFAERAQALDWSRPELETAPCLKIERGRHPVVEAVRDQPFEPLFANRAVDLIFFHSSDLTGTVRRTSSGSPQTPRGSARRKRSVRCGRATMPT